MVAAERTCPECATADLTPFPDTDGVYCASCGARWWDAWLAARIAYQRATDVLALLVAAGQHATDAADYLAACNAYQRAWRASGRSGPEAGQDFSAALERARRC